MRNSISQTDRRLILQYLLASLFYFLLIVPLPFKSSSSGSLDEAIGTGISFYILFYTVYLLAFAWFMKKISGRSMGNGFFRGMPVTLFFLGLGPPIVDFVLPLPMMFEAEVGLLIGLFNVIPLVLAARRKVQGMNEH